MTRRIVVGGLGPGGPGQLTEATLAAIDSIDPIFLRTTVHPTAYRAGNATSFDSLYEKAETFDEVYREIARLLLAAAETEDEILYLVPGSPLVLERSVRYLQASAKKAELDVEIVTLAAVSFLDEMWARLQVDPIDAGVRLVDGHRFASEAAGERGPLVVAHTHASWVLSDIKLAVEASADQKVVVVQRVGTDQENIQELAWVDLDRLVEPDHLTSLYIPELNTPVAAELQKSVELMKRLRRQCPWDNAQTHASLRTYLVEETYEVVDAIDQIVTAGENTQNQQAIYDAYIDLEEELGDLWFQILFHSQIAEEVGQFTIADVAQSLHTKMVERHPHVFAAETEQTPDVDSLVESWDEQKRRQKGRASSLDGIARSLPALQYADKVIGRAVRAGAQLPKSGELSKDLDSSAAVGRLLLQIAADAKSAGIDAEHALRLAVNDAAKRFREAEVEHETANEKWLLG